MLIARRVDWFQIGFRGELKPDVVAELTAALQASRSARTSVAVTIGDVLYRLNARSRDGWWVLENSDVYVVVDEMATAEFRVEVQARAMFIARVGVKTALAFERHVADSLLVRPTKEHLRRADLCADFVGFDLDGIDEKEAVVAQRRALVKARSVTRSDEVETTAGYMYAARSTGFEVGKRTSGLFARVYDKSREINLSKNDFKREDEQTAWKAGGWDGESAITRVEFEIRGVVLRELGARDPDAFVAKLDELWQYTTRWMRLVLPNTATRTKRCKIDPRWRAVQDVVFVHNDGSIAQRVRHRGSAGATLVLGTAINHAAAMNQLQPPVIAKTGRTAAWDFAGTRQLTISGPRTLAEASARDKATRIDEATPDEARALMLAMGEDEARRLLRATVTHILAAAGNAAASELVQRHGSVQQANLYLFERSNAAIAKLSSSSDVVLERLSIEGEPAGISRTEPIQEAVA